LESGWKRISCILLTALFLIIVCFPAAVYANAAEPPALVVIIENAPEDVEVSIAGDNGLKEARKKTVAWETYYAFYRSSLGDGDEITLIVSGDGERFEKTVDLKQAREYDTIVTLDFEEQTLEPGKLLSRSILLVTLRVALTLLIEGLVFYLFGFRRKNSWIAFLAINLLTQGVLNIQLNNATPFASYLIFNLIFMELVVLLVEMIFFVSYVREHGKFRRAAYVFVANLASLVLGGWLITVLPV